MRADVAVSGPIVFITLSAEDRGYPIVIENASDYSFTLSQAVSVFAHYRGDSADLCTLQLAAEPGRRAMEKKYSLNAHSEMPFAWDDPMQEEKILRLSVGNQEREIKVLEIGAQVPFKFAVSWAICDLSRHSN